MDYFKEWLGELGIDAEINAMESNKLTEIILDGEFDAFEWGWYVEPDPDSMLRYMTCDQRGDWSDSWYCDEEYDALYARRTPRSTTPRAEPVKQMQQILYEDAPYLVTAYNTIGEAVRSDRFACFEPQPDPGGIWLFQYGVSNYLTLRPADEAGDCDGAVSAIGATEGAASAESRRGRRRWSLIAGGAGRPRGRSAVAGSWCAAAAHDGRRPRVTLVTG